MRAVLRGAAIEGQLALRSRAAQGFGDRMADHAFRFDGQAQKLVFGATRRGVDGAQGQLSAGEGTGFVEGDDPGLCQAFDADRVAQQDALFGGLPACQGISQRHGQSDRAGAGCHQNAQGTENGTIGRHADPEVARQRGQGDHQHDGQQPAHEAFGGFRERGSCAKEFQHAQAQQIDPALALDGGHAQGQRALQVDGAGQHSVAHVGRGGQGFSRHERTVQRAGAGDDFAIDGNTLVGAHQGSVAHLYFVKPADARLGAGFIDQGDDLGCQLLERVDGKPALLPGMDLDQAASQQEGDQHGGRIHVDQGPAFEQLPERDQHGTEYAQGYECVHAGQAGAQRAAGGAVEVQAGIADHGQPEGEDSPGNAQRLASFQLIGVEIQHPGTQHAPHAEHHGDQQLHADARRLARQRAVIGALQRGEFVAQRFGAGEDLGEIDAVRIPGQQG
ncbi:Uncharacterised protein [Bordetella trematum]|nr:Uncharacterised protein [Bordetella trematum]